MALFILIINRVFNIFVLKTLCVYSVTVSEKAL